MTSQPLGQEFDNSPIDFRAQLQGALEHALPDTPGDPHKNGETASNYSRLPDDYVISFLHFPSNNQVYTTEAPQYLELLRQAAEVLDGTTDRAEEDDTYLNEAAEHEITHGRAAQAMGNSDTVSYYGVAFVVGEDGEPSFWPYHFTAGPLKKVHHAWTAVAPEDRSETDMAIARDLGYSEEPGELRKRALAEAPVDEGWQPLMHDKVVQALQHLLATYLEDPQS